MMRALLAVLLILSPAGFAAGAGHGSPQVFSVHDHNRDGYLDREEYSALRERCLERREFAGRHRCDAARLLDFDRIDANQDGRIDEQELLDALGRRHRGGGGPRTPATGVLSK